MDPANEAPSLDALADTIAARSAVQLTNGSLAPVVPRGEPDLERPPTLPPFNQSQIPNPRIDFGSRVAIAGVEYTQSVQYNSVTTPTYGDDNSVSLVAYKTLVVRMYPTVRRGQLGGDDLTNTYVTGELTLSTGNRILYQTSPSRVSGARLGPTSRIDRTLWDREITVFGTGVGGVLGERGSVFVNCPLNFIVPAYYCRVGRTYVTVRLWPIADGTLSSRGATAPAFLNFLDVQAPKVCLVRVNWTDSAGNVNKPTDAQMLNSLKLAERMLPFPYFETTILSTKVSSSAAFATAATGGGCNAAWSGLLTDLNVTRIFTALFELGDIVYGMVPQAAIPAGATTINSGCGRGAGGSFVGYDSTFAHELGHLYGRQHVAVPGDSTNDTTYPNYGGSNTSIGEVGIDTGTLPPTLFDPSINGDIMSYSNNQWISPYTYQSILDARSMHQSRAVNPKRLRPLFLLVFRLYSARGADAKVEIKTTAHLRAPGSVPYDLNAVSPVSIDLLDADKRILATHHCMYIPPHGGGNCQCCHGPTVSLDREPWLDFVEAIEWPEAEVASIAFHSGAEPFYTIETGEPPRVEITGPERSKNQLVVRVIATHPSQTVSVIVLFSHDDGVTWQPVAFNPYEGLVRIENDRLFGGEHCVFRAIATAALRSVSADTEHFQLPRTPRRLYISGPSKHCPIAAGPVALALRVDTRGLGPIALNEIRWFSSVDGELGNGYSLTPHLSEGRHEIIVTAPDGFGGTLSERGIIVVGGRS